MSMFKNTSKRRVLSWILTLTMLFSQFFGTSATLTAFADDCEHAAFSLIDSDSADTFKVECKEETCKKKASLKILPPEDLTYDGGEKEIYFETAEEENGLWSAFASFANVSYEDSISYYRKNEDGSTWNSCGVPVEVGTYKAKATVTITYLNTADDPVSRDIETGEFVIKPSIAGSVITLDQDEFVFDGQEHTVEVSSVVSNNKTLVKDADYEIDAGSSALSATDAGTYTITLKGINGYVGEATVQYVIKPKAIENLVVELGSDDFTYTGSAQTVTVTVKESADGDALSNDLFDITGNTQTNAGKYTITVTGKTNGNYSGSTGTVEWRIKSAVMDVEVEVDGDDNNDGVVTYDGSDHGLNITAKKHGSDDVLTDAVIRYWNPETKDYTLTVCPKVKNVADGPLVVKYSVKLNNYVSVEDSVTITIAKRTPDAPEKPVKSSATTTSITLVGTEDDEYEYRRGTDGEWQDSPVFEGLKAGQNYVFYKRYKADSNTNVSEVSPASDGLSTNPHAHDYEYSSNGSVITATCKDTDHGHGEAGPISVNFVSANDLKYNGEAKGVTCEDAASLTAIGLTVKEIVYEKKTGDNTWEEVGSAVNVGEYKATVSFKAGTEDIEPTVTVLFSIEKADWTVAAANAPKGKDNLEYKGASGTGISQSLLKEFPDVPAASNGKLKVSVVKDDNKAPAADSYDEITNESTAENYFESVKGIDAGTYYVWYIWEGNENYNDSEPANVPVVISPRAVTIIISAKEKIYGEPDPKLTATTTEPDNTDIRYSLKREEGQDVKDGGYKITATEVVNKNYIIDKTDAYFTINKRSVSVDGIIAFDKEYDGTSTATLSFNVVTFYGRVNDDDIEITATGTFTDENGYSAESVSSDKTVTINKDSYVLSGKKAGNYTLNKADSQGSTTASITKRPLKLEAKAQEVEKDGTIKQGDDYIIKTGSVADGDTLTYELKASITSENVDEEGVISFNNVKIKKGDNDRTDQYDIELVSGNLIITLQKVTVTAAPVAYSVTYDGTAIPLCSAGTAGANAEIWYSLNENSGFSSKIPTAVNAGEYQVYYKAHSTSAEYSDSTPKPIAEKSEIAKATVIVIASDNKITYGDAKEKAYNGVSYEGLLDIDNAEEVVGDLTYDTDYAQFADTGKYEIRVSGRSESDNYVIGYNPGELTVEEKEIGLVWSDTELTYNGEVQVPTASANGTVNNDEIVVKVKVLEEGANAGKIVGEYTASANKIQNKDNTDNKNYKLPDARTCNYSIVSDNAIVTALPVSADGLIYDGSAHPLIATTAEVTNGTISYAVSDNDAQAPESGWVLTTIPEAKDAGTYYVWYKAVGNANYNDSQAACISVDIAKKDATITVNGSLGKVYGETEETITASLDGFVVDTDADYTLERDPGEDAGEYEVRIKLGKNPNYNITTQDGAFTISKRPVTISGITAKDKVYDGTDVAELVFDKVIFTGICGEDTLKVTADGKFPDANVCTGAEVTIEHLTLGGANAANYKLASDGNQEKVEGKSITAAPLIIKPNDQSVRRTDTPSHVTVTVDDLEVTGLVSEDKVTAVAIDETESTTTEVLTNSGKIVLKASETEILSNKGTSVKGNYNITYKDGRLTVSAPDATVTKEPEAKALTYTGGYLDLVEAGNCVGGTLKYKLSTDSKFTEAVPSAKNAGKYIVQYYVDAASGYQDSEVAEVEVEISKKDLKITAKDNAITYGEEPSDNGFDSLGFVTGETESVLGGKLEYKHEYAKFEDVGAYTISVNGFTSDNYNITYENGTLTVNPAEAHIKWGELTLTYTSEEQAPEATVVESDIVSENDIVSVNVIGKETAVGGPYTAIADSLTNENYVLVGDNLEMSYKIVTATEPLITKPSAKSGLSYNGVEQELVNAGEVGAGKLQYAIGTKGAIPGEDSWSDDVPKKKDAGSWYVWFRIPAEAGLVAYDAELVSENAITIEKADLTVYAEDKNITYGDDLPAYTISFDGIQEAADTVNSLDLKDKYEASCSYNKLGDVGSYTISVNTVKPVALENYNISIQNGTLTVDPIIAELDWEPDAPIEFIYNGEAQAPTATVTNALEGDTVTVTVTGAKKDVGYYTATASELSDSNYALPTDNTIDFSIKIAESTGLVKPVAITSLSYNRTYHNLVTAGSVTGADIEYAVSKYDNVAPENEDAWSTTVPSRKDAGDYCVWFRLNGHGNYTDNNKEAELVGTVNIAQAPIRVTSKDLDVPYGTPREDLDVQFSLQPITGFIPGDTVDNSFTGNLSFICDYTPYGNEEYYAITPTGYESNNYKITFVGSRCFPIARTVTLIWDDTEFVYDGQAHVPTVSADNVLDQDKNKIVVVVKVLKDNSDDVTDSVTDAGTYLAKATEVLYVVGQTTQPAIHYTLPKDATVPFTIAKADISANKITKPEAISGLVYSASSQQLVTAGTVSDNLGTFKYALAASENTALSDLTFGTSIPTGVDAGTYYVWFNVSANTANYNNIAAEKVSVSIDAATVTVSYNANEGTGTKASEEFEIGSAADIITVSDNSFSREGYEFVSWNTAADGSGTGYAEGDTFAPETIEDITLYAQWKPITFSVSFNMNGHGEQIDAVEVISGNTVEAPADPTADGFAFGGWFTEAECSTSYNFATPVTEDIELFAKWTEKFTVSFNMSGRGTQIPAQEVVSGDTASKPADPTADGYAFIGWFTEGELTNEYDFATPVSANITLFAKWTEKFTVSFNMSGHGTQIPSQEVVSGDKAVRPADPTDPEYTFEDWFTAADYASVYDFDKAVSENITVYAKWNVTVSLDSISINKAPDKTSYTEGEVFDTTGMEVVATYTDGSKKTVSGYTITPSANLTASDNKVTVSYTEDSITCTADVAIKVVAKDAADVVVEDEDYSAWNLYEDTTEHTYTVAGASSNVAVKNSNTKSATYYDAVLSGNTITVTVKGDLKSAAKAANSVLEFATDDGVVEFTLPVEYKKPVLKLSAKKATIKDGAESVVRVTVLRKSASGVFEPMNLDGAEVTYGSQAVELEDEGVVAITVSGAVKNTKISVVGEGWNSADPVQLAFSVKASKKSVLTVEMGTAKNVILNGNAKGQSFEFPVYFNGEAADGVTVDDAGTGIANVEGGVLTVAYPEGKTVKAKTYTVKLSKDGAKASVKVKVSNKDLSSAVKLTVKSKYDVVTGQKMVIVPNFKDLGGKLEDVNIEMNGFSAVVNEAGNIVVDYEGSAYNVKNLNIGTMTFKLSVEGVEDEIAVTINNVKAKKSSVKIKAAAVTLKAGAEGVANLVCSYTDSAKNLHLVAPLSVKIAKVKNVTATVSEEDPTVINLSGFTGKKGSVKVTATFPGGLTKTVTITVKPSK